MSLFDEMLHRHIVIDSTAQRYKISLTLHCIISTSKPYPMMKAVNSAGKKAIVNPKRTKPKSINK